MKLTKHAQEILDLVKSGRSLDELEDYHSDIDEWSCSDGFWYGLVWGGYIKPSAIVHDDDLAKLNEAIDLVSEFESIRNQISREL